MGGQTGAAPFLIGLAGGTCSGKTTFAERLAEANGSDQVALIKLDSYYKRKTRAPGEDRIETNYDHPDAFDWPLLNDHLAALKAGATIPVPVYDYTIDDRTDEVRMVAPCRIVVMEGILVLYEPTLRERFDLRVFIDVDADIRLIRRIHRDIAERGRSLDSVISQYLATVRPSHEHFIEPSKRHADVILPLGGENHAALALLTARIGQLLED
ncbi:MAG TPA: uridine kinase [Ilumatobacteraceae bacterium]|nr:uridine kinase [Ilumatobacteraceae bacterium]